MGNLNFDIIPQEYYIEKFYQYAGYPKYKRLTDVYEGGCPMCREGKSWGKKRRLYFVNKQNLIFCHNCGWSGSPAKWVKEVTGKSYLEIIDDSKTFDGLTTSQLRRNEEQEQKPQPSLPGECINLYDKSQCAFYGHDKPIKLALQTCKERRLFTAVNKPKTLWFCMKDYVHKDRIIIPFYDNNNIIFYQSRKIKNTDTKPKYLSKIGADKTIFNFDQIDSTLDYIFIFEGPIDSFFVKNGVAVGGISKGRAHYTSKQKLQIEQKPFHEKIWVLDNQWIDTTAKNYLIIKQRSKMFYMAS